MFLSSFKKDQ
jgi:hypothetical protein